VVVAEVDRPVRVLQQPDAARRACCASVTISPPAFRTRGRRRSPLFNRAWPAARGPLPTRSLDRIRLVPFRTQSSGSPPTRCP